MLKPNRIWILPNILPFRQDTADRSRHESRHGVAICMGMDGENVNPDKVSGFGEGSRLQLGHTQKRRDCRNALHFTSCSRDNSHDKMSRAPKVWRAVKIWKKAKK